MWGKKEDDKRDGQVGRVKRANSEFLQQRIDVQDRDAFTRRFTIYEMLSQVIPQQLALDGKAHGRLAFDVESARRDLLECAGAGLKIVASLSNDPATKAIAGEYKEYQGSDMPNTLNDFGQLPKELNKVKKLLSIMPPQCHPCDDQAIPNYRPQVIAAIDEILALYSKIVVESQQAKGAVSYS